MDYRQLREGWGLGLPLARNRGHPHRRWALLSGFAPDGRAQRNPGAAFPGMTKNLWQWFGVTALATAAVYPLPAAAQQAVGGGPAMLTLPPHPTDAGKPVIYDPPFVAKSDDGRDCAPAFSCRLRLLGVIQNNGAVELRATAFTW